MDDRLTPERLAARRIDDALAEFTEYFVANYPGPNTIIRDPKWHAPKIFRAAEKALSALRQDSSGGVVALPGERVSMTWAQYQALAAPQESRSEVEPFCWYRVTRDITDEYVTVYSDDGERPQGKGWKPLYDGPQESQDSSGGLVGAKNVAYNPNYTGAAPAPDMSGYSQLKISAAAQESRSEVLEDKLEKILNWCKAYPLDVFPEPDFDKARKLLEAGGITLDAISASNIRHVLQCVEKLIGESTLAARAEPSAQINAAGQDNRAPEATSETRSAPASAAPAYSGHFNPWPNKPSDCKSGTVCVSLAACAEAHHCLAEPASAAPEHTPYRFTGDETTLPGGDAPEPAAPQETLKGAMRAETHVMEEPGLNPDAPVPAAALDVREMMEELPKFRCTTVRTPGKPETARGTMEPTEIGEWVRCADAVVLLSDTYARGRREGLEEGASLILTRFVPLDKFCAMDLVNAIRAKIKPANGKL